MNLFPVADSRLLTMNIVGQHSRDGEIAGGTTPSPATALAVIARTERSYSALDAVVSNQLRTNLTNHYKSISPNF